ncbi:hypothetical protein CFOL_v3_03404 [Cephalotus follicularis]|uniref:PPR domain-containing protein n=1 Tax=Cephalotus follicularis TaxID=3775 RepID=A0A1Q3AWD8_CEPFO|nr:hypothetical protein CFOL_v3_03404 [Cephalotus follicularis]
MLLDEVEIDSITLLVVIQTSAMFGCLKLGLQLHQIVIKFNYCDDMFIVNSLLNMYIEVGSLELARELFDANPTCDVALWNSMLFVYIYIYMCVCVCVCVCVFNLLILVTYVKRFVFN